MENLNNELYTHPLALYKFNKDERNVIAKLKRSGIYTNRALDIISIDDDKLSQYKDLISKEPSLQPLIIELKNKILTAPDYIRKFIAPISFSSMQRELLEVLNHIKTLKKKDQEIFDIVIFNHEKIDDYCKQHKMNESLIHKHKNLIFKELRTVLFYNTTKYKNYIKSNSSLDIRLEMPELYSKFQGDSFYIFIKNIFDFEDDFQLISNTIDDIDIQECFNNIFQEIALPCTVNAFRNSFYEIEGLNYSQINELMPKIEKQGLIQIKDNKVISANLQFKTAIIQVLLQSDKEMTWNEILDQIKLKNLYLGVPQSKQEFESALGLYDSVIKVSDNSYLHIKNSNLSIDIIDNCIQFINAKMEINPKITIQELYSKVNMPISIFEFTHIYNKINK